MKYIEKKLRAMAAKVHGEYVRFTGEESGMEIIQVLILLALGLGLVAVFMGFSDSIMAKVKQIVDDFLSGF